MNDVPDASLPLEVVRRDSASPAVPTRRFQFRPQYLLVLLLPVFMFSGGVIGMYFQPPALQKFFALTVWQPGGGSPTPIALPPDIDLPPEMVETMQANLVNLLGIPSSPNFAVTGSVILIGVLADTQYTAYSAGKRVG